MPPWLDKAKQLRASGKSLRNIQMILNNKGFQIGCHNIIRYWTEPEFRDRKKQIALKHKRRRAMENASVVVQV